MQDIQDITVFAIQDFFLQKSLISWGKSSLLDFQKSLIFTFLDKQMIFENRKWTSSSRNDWFLEEEVLKRKSQTLYCFQNMSQIICMSERTYVYTDSPTKLCNISF